MVSFIKTFVRPSVFAVRAVYSTNEADGTDEHRAGPKDWHTDIEAWHPGFPPDGETSTVQTNCRACCRLDVAKFINNDSVSIQGEGKYPIYRVVARKRKVKFHLL